MLTSSFCENQICFKLTFNLLSQVSDVMEGHGVFVNHPYQTLHAHILAHEE